MQRVQIDGVALEYETRGSGQPLVFIHGAFISDAFLPLLSEPGLTERYELITYRRRGYGGSTRTPGPISVEQQARDCRALLRALNISSASWSAMQPPSEWPTTCALEMFSARSSARQSLACCSTLIGPGVRVLPP